MQAIFGLDNCCSNAIVSLLSSDGKLVKVNKYFLFLHNDFYKNLLVDLNSDDVTIVFDDVSFCDLLVFQKSVHEKHFKCINTAEDIEQQNTSRTDTGTRSEKKSDSDEQLNIGVDNNEGIEESNEKVENSETFNEIKCPFKCINECKNWTEDTIFAHIFTDHHKDVDDNYQLSIERFIKNLYPKVSIKCALDSNCASFKSINLESKRYSKDSIKGINDLKNHYIQVHGEDSSICDNCGKEFRTKKHLRTHWNDVCNAKDEQCQDCGKIFKGYHNLRRHIKSFHKRKYQKNCTRCDKSFQDIGKLKQHIINIHEKVRNWICDFCGIKMAQFGNLNDHRLKVHGARFPSIVDYRNIVSMGKHPFAVNMEQSHSKKIYK